MTTDPLEAPTVRRVWHLHPGYRTAAVNNVVTALYLGITAVALPKRFGAPTYFPLRETLGMTGWGFVLIAYGVAVAAFPWLTAHAATLVLSAGIGMYFLLGAWFAWGLTDPLSSPWGLLFLSLSGWAYTQRLEYLKIVEGEE